MGERLAGQVAVVTGAASGIGAATTRRLVAEGARVLLADIQDDAGTALAAALSGSHGDVARFRHVDVADEGHVADAVAEAVERWGRLDLLFNNAGFAGVTGPIEMTSAADYDVTMGVLLRSVFHGMKYAAPVMKRQRSGCIVSTSSVCGLQAGIGTHLYSAAKAAVIMLTQSVALELAEYDVRVNCICPGYITTPLTAGAQLDRHGVEATAQRLDVARDALTSSQPLVRAGDPDDIAAMVAFLASDDARWITGAVEVVDGGLTLGTPWRAQRPMLTRYRSVAPGR